VLVDEAQANTRGHVRCECVDERPPSDVCRIPPPDRRRQKMIARASEWNATFGAGSSRACTPKLDSLSR